MRKSSSTIFIQILIVALIIAAIVLVAQKDVRPELTLAAPTALPAAAAAIDAATTTAATSSKPVRAAVATTTIPEKSIVKATESTPPPGAPEDQIRRVENPYGSAPLSQAAVNLQTRGAIVNILCSNTTGLLRPISGSGVIIDPRGVILTNAHVAQYVLLSQSPKVNLDCYVRAGSPAQSRWIPEILYIPAAWVNVHASELTSSHAVGTGEHDYALLWIGASVDSTPLPATFPYVPVDTREGIAFVDDSVLVVSYPAEFLGAIATTNNLFLVSSPTTIQKMLTFTTNLVDALSLGGFIAAQSGSSGGAVVNAWGYLVGLVTTMSDGATTDQRDLRAISLSYVDRDLKTQIGINLSAVLDRDPNIRVADFARNGAPQLIDLYLKVLGM